MSVYTEEDMTPWFPGTVAPAYEGVYERRYYEDDADIDASRFCGEYWRRGRRTAGEALSELDISGYQTHYDGESFEWRGLARDPNAVLREDLLALRELALDAAAEALGEVVASDAPGLALDSGEFIPAAELNAQAAVDDEEQLF
jgi:hypothetical protein